MLCYFHSLDTQTVHQFYGHLIDSMRLVGAILIDRCAEVSGAPSIVEPIRILESEVWSAAQVWRHCTINY